jgi:hypothetical protein
MPPPGAGFSALQRAENSSIAAGGRLSDAAQRFQCSSASRKFLNGCVTAAARCATSPSVSVLFSEPKIPQTTSSLRNALTSFSALQRAENSSMEDSRTAARSSSFSALQRAENSSHLAPRHLSSIVSIFGFSALQRAENSSNREVNCATRYRNSALRFQCSSASRKFLNHINTRLDDWLRRSDVSVLFSEPKIPHLGVRAIRRCSPDCSGFSALQRAENSSMHIDDVCAYERVIAQSFSALQRAENSSTRVAQQFYHLILTVSVLFSEPKIPQRSTCQCAVVSMVRFSALQRAENSSTHRHLPLSRFR